METSSSQPAHAPHGDSVHDTAVMPKDEKSRPMPQWLTKIVPASSFDQSPQDPSQKYLMGVRGALAIMSFLWTFMITFMPATVAHSSNTTGPDWELNLRKSLSVLIWNDSLIYSSIIFLSARMLPIPFLLDSSKTVLASAVFRRGIRLWLPTAAALIVVFAVFTRSFSSKAPSGTLEVSYLEDLSKVTSNPMPGNTTVLPNSLSNFNAIFDVFWVTSNYANQAGNHAFPTQTLWIISALFQQSYTVFATMVIIPYTRANWRLWGAAVFILTAWWVYSWAWFSITALLLADLVTTQNFRTKLRTHLYPALAATLLCLFGGYFMLFYWVAVRPDLQTAEINYHTGPYTTGGVHMNNDPTEPQLRADNYLVILGFHLALELSSWMRAVFANPVLVFLGKRSLSYFLLQSTIIYTLGAKLFLPRIATFQSYSGTTGIVFIATLLVTFAAGEIFFWLIDVPTRKFARGLWAWLRT